MIRIKMTVGLAVAYYAGWINRGCLAYCAWAARFKAGFDCAPAHVLGASMLQGSCREAMEKWVQIKIAHSKMHGLPQRHRAGSQTHSPSLLFGTA
jgi:hypothetical protein